MAVRRPNDVSPRAVRWVLGPENHEREPPLSILDMPNRPTFAFAAVLSLASLPTLGAVTHHTISRSAATSLVTSAQRAALGQRSVEASVSGDAGGLRFTGTVVGNETTGYANLTVSGKAHGAGKERLVKGKLYAYGTGGALEEMLSLPVAPPSKYSGHWLLVPKDLPAYAAAESGLTLPSLLHDSSPVDSGGSLRPKLAVLNTTKRDGVSVRAIQSTVTGLGTTVTATLYVRASGSPLPVAYVASMGKTVISSITFEKWGVPVRVAAPAAPLTPTSKEILRPVPQKSFPTPPKKK